MSDVNMGGVAISMSATVGKLAAALAKAQKAMRPAVKDAKNPHFKNTYASLVSCIEAIAPLHENEIAVVQPPALHGPDGVCVTTMLIHSSGEWIRGELYMPASKRDAQGFGSAISYARRYCLQATAGLATDDDDGEEAVRGSGSLERPLQASVDHAAWEKQAASQLTGARSMGELMEAWQAIYERAKASPNGTFKRLSEAKDARKRELS